MLNIKRYNPLKALIIASMIYTASPVFAGPKQEPSKLEENLEEDFPEDLEEFDYVDEYEGLSYEEICMAKIIEKYQTKKELKERHTYNKNIIEKKGKSNILWKTLIGLGVVNWGVGMVGEGSSNVPPRIYFLNAGAAITGAISLLNNSRDIREAKDENKYIENIIKICKETGAKPSDLYKK